MMNDTDTVYMNKTTYEILDKPGKDTFLVDAIIAPTIQVINQKGYRTSACCSGHADKGYKIAYVQFGFGELTPEAIPSGWYWAEDGLMEYEYTSECATDFEQEITNTMSALLTWAESLPDAN